MRRTTALPAVTLPAAAVALALLAGCTNGTPTTIGAPTAGTSAAAPTAGTNSTAPAPTAGTDSAAPAPAAVGKRLATSGGSSSGPGHQATGPHSVASPDSWKWTFDTVRLPDGTVAVVDVPSGWAATTRVSNGRSQRDRRSADGSLLLRIEYGRTSDEPELAVQRAAADPYASWPGYARSATTVRFQLRNPQVMASGAQFTFRDASGSRQASVTTYARPGWVLTIYSSFPDRTAVRTGGWELAQRAGAVRFLAS